VRTEISVDAIVARTPTLNMSGVKWGVTGKKERQVTMNMNTNNRRRRSQLLQATLRLIREFRPIDAAITVKHHDRERVQSGGCYALTLVSLQ
jgi:hypothetical protein